MHKTVQALLGLQEIDRRLYKVEAELRRLPAELAGRQAELGQRQATLAELRRQSNVLRSEAKEIEDYTTGMRQRQRKLESESVSRKIDAAMLASFEHEIRSLKRNISQAEDDALKKLGQAEEIDAEAAELAGLVEEESRVLEVFRSNVESELADAEARHASLTEERQAASSDGVTPAALDLYRRLLETREGEAMAELADGHCQVCFVQIPKNLGVRLAKGELVQCPSCGRILYSGHWVVGG